MVKEAQMALVWESILRMLSLLPQGNSGMAVLPLKRSTGGDSLILIFGETVMAGKRDKPEVIVLKLRQVDILQGRGNSIADAVRQIAVTEQTYYQWRKEYGGMCRDQLKRWNDLETENARLSWALSDLTLDKMILTEVAREDESFRYSLHRSHASGLWWQVH